jgi:hypothetical protein
MNTAVVDYNEVIAGAWGRNGTDVVPSPVPQRLQSYTLK